MDIRSEVAYLKHYYKTDDPFDVISGKNIMLFNEELGSIRGYYKQRCTRGTNKIKKKR